MPNACTDAQCSELCLHRDDQRRLTYSTRENSSPDRNAESTSGQNQTKGKRDRSIEPITD